MSLKQKTYQLGYASALWLHSVYIPLTALMLLRFRNSNLTQLDSYIAAKLQEWLRARSRRLCADRPTGFSEHETALEQVWLLLGGENGPLRKAGGNGH